MRNMVIRSSKVLLTLASLGILMMVVAFLNFTGVLSWVDVNVDPTLIQRGLFGFDYETLIAFAFYLVLIGLIPVLASMDTNAQKGVKKIYIHLLLLIGIGFIFLIYSALLAGSFIEEAFDPLQTWFDYFIFAALIITIGLSLILFSVQDRERLWSFKPIFLLFILIGLLLQIISIVLYSKVLDSSIADLELGALLSWEFIFFLGLLVLFIGIVPFLLASGPRFRSVLHSLRIFWVLGILIGFILIILSYIVYTEMIEQSLLMDIEWFAFLTYGSLLTILATTILVSSEKLHNTIHKLRILWVLAFFIGFLLIIVSVILVLPTSFYVEDAIGELLGTELLEIPWDLFYMYGNVVTVFSLILICSILFFETKNFAGPEGLVASVDQLPGAKATPSEMIAYLSIVSKSNKTIISAFKEAVRADKFRPRVYEAIIKQYQDQNRTIKSRIDKLQKEGPAIVDTEEAEAIFDVAIGEPSEVTAPSKEVSDAAPPPPMPPKAPTPSTRPPTPTPTPLPPTPSPSMPTPPPPSPISAPAAPTAASAPSKESPLDLIADARSTSIAELRGEMLKELRRLREIFKEE